MKNFRLTVEYDGTDYNGWQAQDRNQKRKGGRVKTIQGTLGDALYKIFSRKVKLTSSGRTDSGVHAKAHIANFKSLTRLRPLQIKKALNSILPDDIIIKKVELADLAFNAQFDASSKTYRYLICNQEHVSPFVRRYVYHFRQPLDVAAMKKEAKVLCGRHDFLSFKSSGGKTVNPRRTIKKLKVGRKGKFIEIEIEADGFLYNMVRNIVGTLIEIGRGKLSAGSTKQILRRRDRRTAGPTAPAKGLCLIKVKY